MKTNKLLDSDFISLKRMNKNSLSEVIIKIKDFFIETYDWMTTLAGSGITIANNVISLGGNIGATTLTGDNVTSTFEVIDAKTVNFKAGDVTVDTAKGIVYTSDPTANLETLSVPPKSYVDAQFIKLTRTVTQNIATQFFTAGYILEYMTVVNTTANAPTTLSIGNNTGAFIATADVSTGSASILGISNPSAVGVVGGGYTSKVMIHQPLFTAATDDLVVTAANWNASSYDLTFYLKKLL